MSTHPYTEDQLIEQPAIQLFATLGWQIMSAMDMYQQKCTVVFEHFYESYPDRETSLYATAG